MHHEGIKYGDATLTTSVISPIRSAFPNAYIAMLANPVTKDIYDNNPCLNEIILSNYYHFKKVFSFLDYKKLKRKKFDLVINLSFTLPSNILAFLTRARYRVGWDYNGSGFCLTTKVPFIIAERRKKHEVEYYLDIVRAIGLHPVEKMPRIYPSEKNKKYAKRFLRQHGISERDFLIGIHPGAAYSAKCWYKERFAKVIDILAEKFDVKFLLLGPSNDIVHLTKARIIDGTKKSTGKLIALIKECNLFICNDSGPMHIAVAVKTPVVAIFIPNVSIRFGPLGKYDVVICKDVDCSPCKDNYFNRCKLYDNKPLCINLIRVEDVVRVVEKQIIKFYKNYIFSSSNRLNQLV